MGEDPTGDIGSVHFEDWLQVSRGEDYYLFINNFSNVNSGFSIQFTGDIFIANPTDALDCSVIDNLLGASIAACEGETVVLDATTIDAASYEWYSDTGNGFELISREVSPNLSVTSSGSYRVVVTTRNGNTESDVQVVYNQVPLTADVSDEVFCCTSEMIFDLRTKDSEVLGGQDTDDFIVSYHHTQDDAITGLNPIPKQFFINPAQEDMYIRTASLSNPNCFDASQSFSIHAVVSPELTFAEEVSLCENSNGVVIGETIPNPLYSYMWNTGETTPSITVSQSGEYTLMVTHSVAGISCEVSKTVSVSVSQSPIIAAIARPPCMPVAWEKHINMGQVPIDCQSILLYFHGNPSTTFSAVVVCNFWNQLFY